jgi:hypothetical protein
MHIDENNVAEYIGKTIHAQKASEILEGVILGRSETTVVNRDGKPIHPIKIETKTEIRHLDLTDWKIILH